MKLHAYTQRAYTIANFCRTYDVGKTTTYKLIKEGDLQTFKIGRRTLITADSAAALAKQPTSGGVS
ncbi:MAG: hypothetical protein JWO15_1580 [Sphingomonadales bacterium]|nr:hypothetical protein [Sphingomonadales bacterium]